MRNGGGEADHRHWRGLLQQRHPPSAQAFKKRMAGVWQETCLGDIGLQRLKEGKASWFWPLRELVPCSALVVGCCCQLQQDTSSVHTQALCQVSDMLVLSHFHPWRSS